MQRNLQLFRFCLLVYHLSELLSSCLSVYIYLKWSNKKKELNLPQIKNGTLSTGNLIHLCKLMCAASIGISMIRSAYKNNIKNTINKYFTSRAVCLCYKLNKEIQSIVNISKVQYFALFICCLASLYEMYFRNTYNCSSSNPFLVYLYIKM